VKSLDGYEEVADRIQRFLKKYPEGSLMRSRWGQVEIGGQTFVYVESCAYRHPEDDLPGTGTAWCQFPGRTPFQRGSELMNAETASWGRALASIGFGGKKIATVDEVSSVSSVKTTVDTLSPSATEFIAFVAKEKVPADKIKLCLGAMGIAVGNKRLKTVLAGMTDEQIETLMGRVS
jgi:hypothetical protein